ncbi:MAG TPA: hypothetical protein VFE78_32420 [Gemmataceae bacterium]|nr:hypothetical protein [Gemmataceae bacterium]
MLTAAAWLTCLALGAPGAVEVPTHVSPSRRFLIPVWVEENRRDEITVVVIHVSADEGKTWRKAGEVAPDQAFLKFQAPKDGLYWLTPQLICRNKEKFPPDLSTARPTLKVRVDTGVKSPVLPETGVLARNAAELQTKVWKLEKRIAELEKKAAELEKRIAELEKKQKEPPGPAACGPR